MKVKATKVMATELNKVSPFTVILEKLTETQYAWLVDLQPLNHMEDYNYNTDKFNVLKVVYPAEYYACSKYVTTDDLLSIFHSTSNKSWQGFVDAFNDALAI